MSDPLVLYGYYRSSAAYRVRIAAQLKDAPLILRAVNLKDGAHRDEAYGTVNVQHLVPTLVHGDLKLGQSLAIIEYLEALYPLPSLWPEDARGRALVNMLAQIVACDIHPVNNLRILNALRDDQGLDRGAVKAWVARWVSDGFSAFEEILTTTAGAYCFGDTPSLADVCLVPQVYNAERFEVDLEPFAHIRRITAACRALEPFAAAAPEAQSDAP